MNLSEQGKLPKHFFFCLFCSLALLGSISQKQSCGKCKRRKQEEGALHWMGQGSQKDGSNPDNPNMREICFASYGTYFSKKVGAKEEIWDVTPACLMSHSVT